MPDSFEDVLATFATLGAKDALPRLFVGMTRKGLDQDLGDKALTAVIDVLCRENAGAGKG